MLFLGYKYISKTKPGAFCDFSRLNVDITQILWLVFDVPDVCCVTVFYNSSCQVTGCSDKFLWWSLRSRSQRGCCGISRTSEPAERSAVGPSEQEVIICRFTWNISRVDPKIRAEGGWDWTWTKSSPWKRSTKQSGSLYCSFHCVSHSFFYIN